MSFLLPLSVIALFLVTYSMPAYPAEDEEGVIVQSEDLDAQNESIQEEDTEMERGEEPPPEDTKFEKIGKMQKEEEADGAHEAFIDEDRNADRGDGMK